MKRNFLKCSKESLKRFFRYAYLRVVRVNDAPNNIALGVAIGVFLGPFPTFGLAPIIAYFLAAMTGANKASAVIGGLLTLPVLSPIFWALSAGIGSLIVDINIEVMKIQLTKLSSFGFIGGFKALFSPEFLPEFGRVLIAYMAGNIIVSLIAGVVAYFLTFEAAKTWKARKKKAI